MSTLCPSAAKHSLLAVSLITLVAVVQSAAQSPSYPAKPDWSATPIFVRQSQGKYPGTVNVVLYWNSCQPDNTKGKAQKVNDKIGDKTPTYKIVASGSGITASVPAVGDCTLTATLTIDSSTQSGDQLLVVSQATAPEGPFTDKGVAILSLLDATAGPTPGKPEVDVMWDVMSQGVCSDDFGNHLPGRLYCIEVKIGNNSAHSLQLAGIGFKRPSPLAGKNGIKQDADLTEPNTSYQTARAIAQTGRERTTRNIIYNSVQALGLVMASFTPFFHNSNNSFRWSTGAAIVSGPLLQGFALVAPDLTLGELNNLDDQSFRDGKLIPNNTQVRMIVFVDKEAVKEAIRSTCDALRPKAAAKGDDPESPDADDAKNYKNRKCKDKPTPTVVKLALGDLVIVGRRVDFLQRIVVDTSVTSQEVTPPVSITTSASLPDGQVNQQYSVSLAAGGGTSPYTWIQPSDSKLPDGLTLDPSGKITGTPKAAGTSKFTLQVTDSAKKTASQEFTIAIPK